MQIVIEKNIPLFPRGGVGRPKSPMTLIAEKMEPGDSFIVKMKPSKLHGQLSYLRRKKGYKFSMRTTENGIRVWRIA